VSRLLRGPVALAAVALAAAPLAALAQNATQSYELAAPLAAQNYELDCMGCHGVDGHGVPGKIPPLAHSLARFMRTPAGRNYVLRVPGAADSPLSDGDLAAVLNWIAQRFDAEDLTSKTAPFTEQEVARVRRHPMRSVLARRREVVQGLAATGAAPPLQY
jgi:mono/diheme cytochrome c family protein